MSRRKTLLWPHIFVFVAVLSICQVEVASQQKTPPDRQQQKAAASEPHKNPPTQTGTVAPLALSQTGWPASNSPRTLDLLSVLATVLLAFLTIPIAIGAFRDILEKRRLKDQSIFICRARSFDPGLISTAFGVHDFREYWPITADMDIEEALTEHSNILLVGRPHIGKSRAAAQHIKKHFGRRWVRPTWWVLRPLPYCVDNVEKIRIRKRRYILLLDDVDHFLSVDKTGVGVLQLVQHLQQQAKQLVVIATVRRTLPEFETLESNHRILGRWRQVEIHDWSDREGADLATKLGTDLSAWDGTPLSVIQPSPLMTVRYRQARPAEKRALHALKLCGDCGLVFVPRDLFVQIYKLKQLGQLLEEENSESVIESLYHKGFLKPDRDFIQSYPGYFGMISDWVVTSSMREELKDALVAGSWTRQLAAFGRARARANDLSDALVAHEVSVALEPNNSTYHYNLGVVLSRLRRWHDAALSFQHAVNLDPRWAGTYYRLARALQEDGREQESAEARRRARQVGSGTASSHYQTGELFRIMGRTDDAIDEFHEAIRLSPRNADTWQALGRALREESKWQDAANAHRHAIEYMPEMAEAYFGLAEPLSKLGDLAGAKEMYEKAIELGPDIAAAYCFLARLLERKGDRKEAEKVLRKAAGRCPKDAHVHSYLGQILGSTRRNVEALDEFATAVKLMPSYVEARVGLAMQQRILGRNDAQLLEEAIKNNRKAVENDPGCASGYYGLGMCYMSKKDWETAEENFQEATRCNSKMGTAWYHRALANHYSRGALVQTLLYLVQAEQSGYDRGKIAEFRAKLPK
ncbi:MAG: tetratricopeptide repeat protein [Acidobacteriaceae bacterium]